MLTFIDSKQLAQNKRLDEIIIYNINLYTSNETETGLGATRQG